MSLEECKSFTTDVQWDRNVDLNWAIYAHPLTRPPWSVIEKIWTVPVRYSNCTHSCTVQLYPSKINCTYSLVFTPSSRLAIWQNYLLFLWIIILSSDSFVNHFYIHTIVLRNILQNWLFLAYARYLTDGYHELFREQKTSWSKPRRNIGGVITYVEPY